ncbi:MAG: hypothetical protein GQ573_02955, partial [Gammaproteobacteria bacterium]|nr:hypothetical protein [Gammaproteobacteria bacterium]
MKKAGELNMCIKKIIFVSLVGLMLSACESDTSTTLQDSLTADNTVSDKDAISNYDLGAEPPVIPFPNDLLFAPNEDVPVSDGTLNIPVDDINDLSDPAVAINGLDGFSTVAPITTGFNTAIDETSISGQSVRVYPITKGFGPGGPATAVDTPLVFGLDYIAVLSSVDVTNSTLAILPLKPLAAKSSYAVVITDKLRTTSGSPFGVSASYALTRATTELYDLDVLPAIPPSTAEEIKNAIKNVALLPDDGATEEEIVEAGVSAATLETLRSTIVKPTEDAIVNSLNTSIASNEIILQWTFTTQSTTDVLTQVRDDIRAEGVPPPVTTFLPIIPGANPVTESPGLLADIHAGTLDVPYFLVAATGVNDPLPLDSFWKGIAGSFLTTLAPNQNPGCEALLHVCPIANSTERI